MHLINDARTEYRFYGNMAVLSDKLQNLGFLRIHKSYLVNMEYIELFQYEKVYLKVVYVFHPVKKHKELKQLYLKWRGKSRWELS